MITLIRTLGRFHLAQQRVHLIDRQQAVRTHRMVAGHGRQEIIARVINAVALPGLRQIRQHISQQRLDVGIPEQCRYFANGQRCGS